MRPLLVLALAQVLAAADLSTVVGAAASEVKPDEAMGHMHRVHATDRWFTFPKFRETADYLKSALEKAGLKKVERIDAPADGVSQFGYWTMPMAWDVKSARLELVEPERRVLADYEKVPASLGMWSGPSPRGGVTAELVAWSNTADVKGKLVLTSRNPDALKWQLAKKGALGAVNTSTENRQLPEGRQWINAWGDAGWAFTKTSTPLLCFSVPPAETARLNKLLAAGGPVRVHAEADTRLYSGVYPYVTAVIPGTGAEEVLTLGHTAEQGAQDNATGVAAMVESVSLLNRLISGGKLPRPRRSIRVLLMPEMYGSMHYIATHPEVIRRTVAAIAMDTPAAAYELPGTEYTFYLNPEAGHSYVDAFVLRVAAEYFPRVGRGWHAKPYLVGTDSYLGEPTVNVPTVWPYSGSGVQTHHNSEDTPDRVDARSLRDITVVNAAFLYYLASAGEAEARWLAGVAAERGVEQIGAAGTKEKVQYTLDREQDAVRGVRRLAPGVDVAPFLAKLEQAARQRAEAAPAGPPIAIPAEAAQMVVKRKRFGTLPLDDLPVEKREGYPSGAWAAVPISALYWCDGHRTLADVIRLTTLEKGPTKFDFVGYFRFLARHGYVDIAGPTGAAGREASIGR